MRVSRRLLEIYEEDFNDLIKRLRRMDKDDRHVLFKTHSRMLFPKSKEIINLEDQLIGRRDYIHKFKRSFFIIGNCFFSTNYFGEYNQVVFIRETGYLSQRYPQKVILALSLMGYITRMIRSYSVGHHGYQYEIDYWKFKKWDKDFFMDIDLDEEKEIPCSIPEFCDEWLYKKQIDTLNSIEVDEGLYSSLMTEKDNILGGSVFRKDLSKDELKKLSLINNIENLYHKTESGMRITIDGPEGRILQKDHILIEKRVKKMHFLLHVSTES